MNQNQAANMAQIQHNQAQMQQNYVVTIAQGSLSLNLDSKSQIHTRQGGTYSAAASPSQPTNRVSFPAAVAAASPHLIPTHGLFSRPTNPSPSPLSQPLPSPLSLSQPLPSPSPLSQPEAVAFSQPEAVAIIFSSVLTVSSHAIIISSHRCNGGKFVTCWLLMFVPS
ncbi:hypothetical protein RIF29_25668 [Crotalaria pallida]|uniref:Uncharacterized protein n=1 Tax=Crotalaria pallida TaxID=3830 RepID=A0AAN9EPB3_CROPI